MKKWGIFSSPAQNPNSVVVAQLPEAVPVVAAADAKQFGLENFGNTCYANSVLQALYFCGPFRDLVVQYPDPSCPDPFLVPPAALPPPTPISPLPQPQTRPKVGRRPSVAEPGPFPPASCASPITGASPTSAPMPTAPPTLLSALRSLYIYISRNPADKGTIAPRAFIDKLKELNELFRSSMHQDAHEFLNYLLNQIVEEMDDDRKKVQNGHASVSVNGNGVGNANGNGESHRAVNGSAGTTPSREDLSSSVGSLSLTVGHQPSLTTVLDPLPFAQSSTLVHRLFEGTLTSETRCLTCETVSSRDESFLDLSIDIEQHSSVTACLRQFSASEMLCQRNKFFCDSCCDLQEAEKRMKIKKLPNILALHLKRFKYQEDVGKYIKLAYRVAFPLELRLFNTVDGASNPDRLYELFAIVVHIGNGPHHGHYVSIIKARNTWYLFDDDAVEPIKETDIPRYFGESNSGSAYVLYYQAADLDISTLGLQPPKSPTADVLTANSSTVHSRMSSTPTAEITTPEVLSPSLPPGLTVTTDQSVRIPSAATSPALTPSSASLDPSPASAQTPASSSLHITMPPPVEFMPSSPTAPPTPSGTSQRGFLNPFNTLRHSPSLRIRPSTSNGVPERRPTTEVPPVPPMPIINQPAQADTTDVATSPARSSALTMSPPVSTSPSASTIGSNGTRDRAKTSTGRASLWKRGSLRQDKSPFAGAVASPPAASDRSMSAAGPEESTTGSWFRPGKRVQRRASEAGLGTTQAASIFQREQHSPAQHASIPSALGSVPEHKKPIPGPSSVDVERQDKRALRRPATAGATVERPISGIVTPLPPLPSPRSPYNDSDGSPDTDHHTALPKDVLTHLNGTAHLQHRPLRSQTVSETSSFTAAPSGLGFSTSNGTSSTLNTMHTAGESASASTASSASATKTKRATRKLSFSAPMLGFGRKEKDKDKDRSGRPQSPAYSQTSSAGYR